MYKRNGFDEVIIEQSPVGVMTKPRGWYRTIRKQGKHMAGASNSAGTFDRLNRNFDVVHCMSGGFLNLYVLLRAGVDIRFSRLLFDSTPILPKPAAFTQFSRAYMEAAGWKLALKALPAKLHVKMVALRWHIGLWYVRGKFMLMQKLGRARGDAETDWCEGPIMWGLRGDFERVSRHALGTVFEIAARGPTGQGPTGQAANIEFVYNPDDPFMRVEDIREAAALAAKCGLPVRETYVAVDHIKGLFSIPKTIFGLLRSDDDGVAASTGGQAVELDHAALAELVETGQVAMA
jgi:hypothetical protein